jgi:hypothetical protein
VLHTGLGGMGGHANYAPLYHLPFLGSRRLMALLRAEGHVIARKRVQRVMRLMGIAA